MKFPQVKKIGIVAPARKISQAEIEPAVTILKSWGLEVVLGKNLFGKNHQFSGTDEERITDFQMMINNPEINAILCARGGYGSARIVDSLDFSPLQKYFKWITGYSDITVLHNAMAKENLPSLHATMPINFLTNDSVSLTLLKEIFLNTKLPNYRFDAHPLNRAGMVKAPIVGGNLSVLYSLRGTRFDLDVSGKILFIEDLDEYLYHIDRMLLNFRLAGWFGKIKGLIVGGMEDMHDNIVPFGKTACEIVIDEVKDFDFPVAFINGIGHTKRNLPLILGMVSTITVDETGTKIIY
ncbi:MAG: LD-carboxypeptidase [Candidatus Zixiibacteriota bacterium]|nr:MAG: LD-carboxypeptidase [candidate division Zixibacteria bacterium]